VEVTAFAPIKPTSEGSLLTVPLSIAELTQRHDQREVESMVRLPENPLNRAEPKSRAIDFTGFNGWGTGATVELLPQSVYTRHAPTNNPAVAYGPDGQILYVTDKSISCSLNYGKSWSSLNPQVLEDVRDHDTGRFIGKQDVLYSEFNNKFFHAVHFTKTLVLIIWDRQALCIVSAHLHSCS